MKELKDDTSLKKCHRKDAESVFPDQEPGVQYVMLACAWTHVLGFSIPTLQYPNTQTL